MSRAAKLQAAVVAILVGLLFILFVGGGEHRSLTPTPVFTQRPATEQEQQEWTEEQLYERLRRQQQEANR